MNLDEIDREIVRFLQADASLTARELAEHVGLTATPVWRRVQILENAGVITGRVALVDPEALGLAVTVMVHVRTNDHSAAWLDRFAAAIEDLPEIIEAYRISGDPSNFHIYLLYSTAQGTTRISRYPYPYRL